MTRSRKSRLERSAERITLVKVSHDQRGNFLPYCSFGCHPGVLGYQKAKECIDRKCSHYKIYREEK